MQLTRRTFAIRGYLQIPYDSWHGLYDSWTQLAVKNYQSANDLVEDGIVGDNTWNKLIQPGEFYLARGSKNAKVTKMQQELNRLGYNVGTADGIFGLNTLNAVIAYKDDVGAGNQGTSRGRIGAGTWYTNLFPLGEVNFDIQTNADSSFDITVENIDTDVWYKMDTGNKSIYIRQPKEGETVVEARVADKNDDLATVYTYEDSNWKATQDIAYVPGVILVASTEMQYPSPTEKVIDLTKDFTTIKDELLPFMKLDTINMTIENLNAIELGIGAGIIDSVFYDADSPFGSILINRTSIKYLYLIANGENPFDMKDNYYYFKAKAYTEYGIMIASQVILTGSIAAGTAALISAGIELTGAGLSFSGSFGVAAPISLVLTVDAARNLAIAGTCAAVAGGAGGAYNNSKSALEKDLSTLEGMRKPINSADDVVFKQSSLDKAFSKHRGDFGNYPDGSKSSVELFKNDISELINTGVQKRGKYRSFDGTHIYNETTKQWTFINFDGTFNTAFKLSDSQFKYLLETGVVK